METEIPKFSYDYDIEMNSALKVLGMTNPFEPSKADFSAFGASDSDNIFISRVPWTNKEQKSVRRPLWKRYILPLRNVSIELRLTVRLFMPL